MFKSRDAGRSGHRGVLRASGHQQGRGLGVRRTIFAVKKHDGVAARDGPFAVAAGEQDVDFQGRRCAVYACCSSFEQPVDGVGLACVGIKFWMPHAIDARITNSLLIPHS